MSICPIYVCVFYDYQGKDEMRKKKKQRSLCVSPEYPPLVLNYAHPLPTYINHTHTHRRGSKNGANSSTTSTGRRRRRGRGT